MKMNQQKKDFNRLKEIMKSLIDLMMNLIVSIQCKSSLIIIMLISLSCNIISWFKKELDLRIHKREKNNDNLQTRRICVLVQLKELVILKN